MSKKSPTLFDDDEIYGITPAAAEFVLNVRKLVDFEFGSRFDNVFAKRIGLDVGFFFHSADVGFWDDSVLIRFFDETSKHSATHFFAVPTGYVYKKTNDETLEVSEYDPPLIAKSINTLKKFSKIRGGMVGLYSGKSLLISACLNFFLLDFNGHYSLIMGPRYFLEKVLGETVEKSWEEVRIGTSIEPQLLGVLRSTMAAYGY